MSDEVIRRWALNPTRSFIVQAPAGSGKTSLLVQRFLSLLATVDRAEKIVAVTFTRKAAQEMRNRIILALRMANEGGAPLESHALHTWELAKLALAQDLKYNWQLLNNPHQLQIMTIDALCSTLSQRMPVLSQLGARSVVMEKPLKLYEKAAADLLGHFEEDTSLGGALRLLCQYCDNRLDWVHILLCELLAKRDQWLAMVVQSKQTVNLRQYLEDNLNTIVQSVLDALEQSLSEPLRSELKECVEASKRYQSAPYVESGLDFWNDVSTLFLTQSGEWRKTITEKNGFPAPSAVKDKEEKRRLIVHKERWKYLVDSLQTIERFYPLLSQVALLPPATYTQEQWQILEALFVLLPALVGHLRLCFVEKQAIDFLELSLNITTALGTLEDSTDLALSLDYQIQHILIDEFQDTSATQYTLFNKLVSEWQPEEGRTLFLVGDPMQSIYRFRGAEVGLFLQVQQQGLGPIRCEALSLTQNFRSSAGIVEWVNRIGTHLMPAHSNLNLGAIAFSKASAVRPDEGGVECYAAETREMEGAWIAQKILTLQKEHPEYTIAVLARSRRHLESTLLALKAAKIRFVAQDLDTLAQNPMIQDLLTLLEAMLNTDNRLAWLSLLRTPWIALSLTDCTRMIEWAKGKEGQSVWEALLDFQSMNDLLSLSAQKRLSVIIPVLQRWMEQRQIGPLMDWIRTLWIALGGPAPYPAAHREAAELFFKSLSETFWGTFVFEDFKEEINQAFDNRSIEAGAIQLMTIHKAKGLEFDVVFLPGLAQRTGSDGAQLMLWLDYPTHHGVDWLLAPIRAYEEDEDRIYGYLSSLQRQKSQYETGRLLYVAITRAAKKAFLSMTLTKSEEGGWSPPAAGCFGGLLWGSVAPQPIDLIAETTAQRGGGKQWPRMPASWILPRPIQEAIALDRPIEIDLENSAWQQLGYAHNASEILEEQSGFGTAVHRLLEGMSTLGFEKWIKRFKGFNVLNWQRFLARFGVLQSQYGQKLSHWISCLEHDIQLQWILRSHREARSEWVIYDQKCGQKYIIDRTFVDEDGVRWIIDYKTSELEADKASSQWSLYKEQLQTYARLVAQLDHSKGEIKTALYYPFTRELQIVPT